MLEYVILGFLMEGDMSGYDLKFFMSVSTAKFFDASFGSIYPALKRLEGRGSITAKEVVEGGKYKKYYEITKEGKEQFLGWMDKPADIHGGKMEHLLKTFFLNHLCREKAESVIRDYIEGAEKELKELDELEVKIKDQADDFKMSTLYFGKEYYRFVGEWYSNVLKRLDDMYKRRDEYENCCFEWKPKK